MHFLKENRLFSFDLDGVNAFSLPHDTQVMQDGDTQTRIYTFPGGLRVTQQVKKYADFGAYEWRQTFENIGSEPTGVIAALWDCDVTLPLAHEEDPAWVAEVPDLTQATKICAPTGSDWSADEFFCDIDRGFMGGWPNHIAPGRTRRYSTSGGRSSEARAPFFRVSKRNAGYILAVGWTGQWAAEIRRTNDAVTLCSGIEDAAFRVLPGESLRTSSAVLLPYQGDADAAQNLWRRLVRTHFSLIGQPGRDAYGPLSAMIWGGMRTSSVLERIEKIRALSLPVDYIWMDAGWYGENTAPTANEFEGDWGDHTGDWCISPLIHPQGLRDVSAAVHAAGKKFMLWVEPERVIRTTPIAKAHPEYFLQGDGASQNWLLNLGDPAAWRYAYDTLAGLIRDLSIDGYRQDFNMSPLPYWRKNDAPDRRGITEILHINGLYRLWDALLAEFPHLLIDNCASGGRRIDIETLRRSMPLWRSDAQCPANHSSMITQCHALTFPQWLPYSGTGAGRECEEYRLRSAYAPALEFTHFYYENGPYCANEEQCASLQRYLAEFCRVRPYLSEDFYPLTAHGTQSDIWCAVQYDRPAERDGVILAYRRENAPYDRAALPMKAVDPAATYRFTDADGGGFTVDGKTLEADGLMLTLPQKRLSTVLFYRAE